MTETPADSVNCPMCGAAAGPADTECTMCGERLQQPLQTIADRRSRLIAGFLMIAFTAPVCAVVSAILTGFVIVAGNMSPFGYGLMLICGLASGFGAYHGWLLITMDPPRRRADNAETAAVRRSR